MSESDVSEFAKDAYTNFVEDARRLTIAGVDVEFRTASKIPVISADGNIVAEITQTRKFRTLKNGAYRHGLNKIKTEG